MKIKSTVVVWSAFFLVTFGLLAVIAFFYIEPREIVVNDADAALIGSKIAKNEQLKTHMSSITWNLGDDHSSLGISHLKWYSSNEQPPSLSFNRLLDYIALNTPLPKWLVKVNSPPWHSREDFFQSDHDVFKNKLYYFLQENRLNQTQYLIFNLEENLPNILNTMKNPFAKMHVYENFYHVAMEKNGVYAMLDYTIFQGDGVSKKTAYNNGGWGLLQVLENMKGDSDQLLQEFVTSADLLLTRRMLKATNQDTQQLTQWRIRLKTYLN